MATSSKISFINDGDIESEDESEIERELADLTFEELQRARSDGSEMVYRKANAEKKGGRANKNRPMEMSSKKPVSRFREVVQVPKKKRENMAREREAEEDANERREVAMAAAAPLRHNFKPKSGITDAQVSKFRELHKRRLQIKAKSKANKRGKGEFHEKRSEANECSDEEETNKDVRKSTTIFGDTSSIEEDNVAGDLVANKRQKLHWGLGTKERWERKSNM